MLTLLYNVPCTVQYTAYPELLLREVGEEAEVLAPHLGELLEESEEEEKNGYGTYKDLSLQSRVMVTRVSI